MEINEKSSLEELFNAFICDEMWAALSYKNAAFVSKGKSLKFANGIFENNSDEEFEHMEELVDMAKALHIVVSFNLNDMTDNCTTPYSVLNPEEDTKALVKMFIESERKAIEGYETALRSDAVKAKPELCQFFGEICNDEHDHLQELEDCIGSISSEKERVSDDYEEKDFDGIDDGDIDDNDENENDGEHTAEESTVSESFVFNDRISMAGLYKKVFEG